MSQTPLRIFELSATSGVAMAKGRKLTAGGRTTALAVLRSTASAEPVDIIVDLLPVELPTRSGTLIHPTTLTIHNTDNPNRGANAEAHNRYIRSDAAVKREVSWHFTVDDERIYQHLPVNEMGWHAYPAANASSIGIEICMHAEMDEAAAYDRAARLCAFLGVQLNIQLPEGLRQHHDWTGKNCPSVLRGRRNGWRTFVDLVSSYQAGPQLMRRGRRHDADENDAVVASIAKHFENHSESRAAVAQARPVPTDDPIGFAGSSASTFYWPIVTRHPRALEVNTLLVGGATSGQNASRRFLADRNGPRFHCGIDLYCSEGDPVIAVEKGRIVNFYHFYDNTYALLVQHDGYVVNYGEVAPNSLSSLGLEIGSAVSAGQRIGSIGGLKMLHFETYATGTTRNYSWPQSQPRPSRLRNPGQLLLDLAASAIRVDHDYAVTAARSRAVSAMQTVSTPPIHLSSPSPPMDARDWHGFENGKREWRYDERGLCTRENGVIRRERWEENLDTMRKIMSYMGSDLLAASTRHGLPPALLMMTVATETHIYKSDKFTGPRTFRWEANVENNDVKPPTLGDYSSGPMQPLGTTARWVIRTKGKQYGLNYKPFVLAPVFHAKPNPKPAQHPLYVYAANLDIGAATIRIRLGKSGFDPIFVAAAFNTGGLYGDPYSPWGLRAYGDHLDRAAKWYGDACACLIEMGIV